MGTRTAERQYGPTWADVLEWVRELESTTHRKVSWKLIPWVGNSDKASIAVVIYLTKTLTPTWSKDEVYAHASWPTNEHKTMPGLLIGLLHEAEKRWTGENRQAVEQARF